MADLNSSAASSPSAPSSVPAPLSAATGTVGNSANAFTDTKPSRSHSPGPPDDAQDLDCNICLFASSEPVVSRCGHLYCWACLHKWLQAGHADCPVCKTVINKKGDIIPLYGRSTRNHRHSSASSSASSVIPPRPIPHHGSSSSPSSSASSTNPSASQSHVSPPFASLFGPSFNFHSQHGTFSFSAGYGLFPAIFGLQFAAFQLQELLRGGGGGDGAGAGGERSGEAGAAGAGDGGGGGEVGSGEGDARLSRFLMFLGVFMLLLLLMY